MKPMLAEDVLDKDIKFPCYVQPKVDGVRALHFIGGLTGRSLKSFKNKAVTELFSSPEFEGLDGEMVRSDMPPTSQELCRETASTLGTIQGANNVNWYLFDYACVGNLAYSERLTFLRQRVKSLGHPRIFVMENFVARNLDDLLRYEEKWLAMGYEGLIVRNPSRPYKHGRSTVSKGELLRVKRFIDAEAEVLELFEGQANENEAQINELGNTFRTSHQANMRPNGMVGAMGCRLLKDIKDVAGTVLFYEGDIIRVGAGRLTHFQRKFYFDNPGELIGKVIKFQLFPKGVKDKPRFPNFQSFRLKEDL
jgi:DNA ligase-1